VSIENTATQDAATTPAAQENTFAMLGLAPDILKAVADAGYSTPSPIQAQAIPVVMAGHDLMATAQTGTGKTAAFTLPALHRIAEPPAIRSKGPRVLVLTPTRELAQQVSDAAAKYGKFMRLKVVSILGGMPYPLQNKLLSNPVDILVATPGRLIDHIERGRIDFSRLEILVLDEADRMLDMGFIDDVEKIAAATPATRQTLLFSATLEGVVGNLAKRLLKDPKRITVASVKERHENIDQRLMYVDDFAHKNRLLDHLLRDVELNQALVFTATKRDADALADNLAAQGHSAAALHGDMNQRDRNRTLNNLRRGQLRILVATDVAARGIDVAGISHVINFDLPNAAEDYVHRIGRTGRGGAAGIAVSFASNRDTANLIKIERYTGQNITAHTVEGLEPKFKPRQKPSGPKRTGGFSRHTAPDSRHGRPEGARREGHSHSRFAGNTEPGRGSAGQPRFNDNAPRRNGNSAAQPQQPRFNDNGQRPRSAAKPGAPRRQGPSFSLGRGHNSNTNGNR
jgi:superfamily II DNA/RNA helicase